MLNVTTVELFALETEETFGKPVGDRIKWYNQEKSKIFFLI